MSDFEAAERPEAEVSVVVPVYDNEDSLEELRARLDSVLRSEGPYEIVFVDDASRDGSRFVLRRLVSGDSRIHLIELDRNRGQHQAALAGLRHATGRWIVLMDADLQDPPEAIPVLLKRGRDGFDAVFAGREGSYQGRWRMVSSRVYRKVLTSVLPLPQGAGMFVALRSEAARRLLAMAGPSSHLVGMIGAAHINATSIPVARHRRASGSSTYTNWSRARSAFAALRWALRAR